jgi:hypothetical protein
MRWKGHALEVLPQPNTLRWQKGPHRWQFCFWPRHHDPTRSIRGRRTPRLPVTALTVAMGRLNTATWRRMETDHHSLLFIWDHIL